MKKIIVCLLSFLSIGQTFSQNLDPVWLQLQSLEGSWYLNDRRLPVFSRWVKISEQVLENQTITVLCGDTIELSRSRLTRDENQIQLAIATDSTGGKWQVFNLQRHGDRSVFFGNEIAAGYGWQFDSENFFTYFTKTTAEIAHQSEFRRFFERVTKIDLRFRAAANFASLFKKGDFYGKQRFEPRPGAEIGLSAAIRSLEGPLSIGVEIGVVRRNVFVNSVIPKDVGYVRRGVYNLTDVYFAVIPEIFIGKNRKWSALAGVYSTFSLNRKFSGKVYITGDAQNLEHGLTQTGRDLHNDWGFILGGSRRIDLPFLPKMKNTYLQFRLNLGNNSVDNLYNDGVVNIYNQDGFVYFRGVSLGFVSKLASF